MDDLAGMGREKVQNKKLMAINAAKKFVQKQYPDCQGALLAGSVVRGEETETSDLDIVVFDQKYSASYRQSFIDLGWPIEVFVHNLSSYHAYFLTDCERARPSLPRMVVEGIVLQGAEVVFPIKQEAKALLAKGPKEWTNETTSSKRYFVTDALEDFIGSTERTEAIFIAASLAEATSEFVLRSNRCWIGNSKWLMRSLRQYDPKFASRFFEAFDAFYQTDDKSKVIELVDEALQPFGGRLFEGYSAGKEIKTK